MPAISEAYSPDFHITPVIRENLKQRLIACLQDNGWKVTNVITQPATFKIVGNSGDQEGGRIDVTLFGDLMDRPCSGYNCHRLCYEDLGPQHPKPPLEEWELEFIDPIEHDRALCAEIAISEFIRENLYPLANAKMLLRCQAYGTQRFAMEYDPDSRVGKTPFGAIRCHYTEMPDAIAAITFERDSILQQRKRKQKITLDSWEVKWSWSTPNEI